MKFKFTYLLLLSLVAVFSASCSTTKDKGVDYAQQEQLPDFNEVELHTLCDVVFEQTSGKSYIIFDRGIKYEVKNNRLVLRGMLRDGKIPVVKIGSRNLSALSLYGTGNFYAKGLSANNLTAVLNGTGNVVLQGKVDNPKLVLNGTGSLNALRLNSKHADCVVNGVGSLNVKAGKYLDVTLNGPGSINYKGRPRLVNKMGTFAYKINK